MQLNLSHGNTTSTHKLQVESTTTLEDKHFKAGATQSVKTKMATAPQIIAESKHTRYKTCIYPGKWDCMVSMNQVLRLKEQWTSTSDNCDHNESIPATTQVQVVLITVNRLPWILIKRENGEHLHN